MAELGCPHGVPSPDFYRASAKHPCKFQIESFSTASMLLRISDAQYGARYAAFPRWLSILTLAGGAKGAHARNAAFVKLRRVIKGCCIRSV